MVPTPSFRFVDAALSTTGPESLSYTNNSLKWLIREHLLLLLAEFPTLSPSAAKFTHDDGSTVRLLNATGFLPLSPSATPPVPLTIWLHQDYPIYRPLVFVSLPPYIRITHDHPFVDPSGATTSPYLSEWRYPRSNLSDLARNLVKVFSLCHPFVQNSIASDVADASLASRREAVDRLATRLHYHNLQFRAEVEEDIEHLSSVQATLRERASVISLAILELEHERASLEKAQAEMAVDTDVLMDWLMLHGCGTLSMDGMEAFEPADEESTCLLENEAADRAIDDVLDALVKAMEQGEVSFRDYLKQVRTLSRAQFFHRAMVVKLEERKRVL